MKKLSHSGKWILGILTLLQLFAGLAIVVWAVSYFLPFVIEAAQTEDPIPMLQTMGGLIIFGSALAILSTGLMIFYMVHAGTNAGLSTSMKVLWILLFLFFGGISEVVYFFMEITPEHSLTARLDTPNPPPIK